MEQRLPLLMLAMLMLVALGVGGWLAISGERALSAAAFAVAALAFLTLATLARRRPTP